MKPWEPGRTVRTCIVALQGAHSTSGADDHSEYNLRSRTVVCDSCGQSSERSGGLAEGLVGQSYFMGTNEPRQVRQRGGTNESFLIDFTAQRPEFL